MEITLNKKNNTEGLIKIKLTESDYQAPVESRLREYGRKASVKGFRAGKVPTGVIKKMYGRPVLVEEINHILSRALSNYIKDNNIKILGEPLPNEQQARAIDWETQKDFEFDYAIGVADDFKYDLSAAVKVKSYPIEVDSKVIEETVTELKKRFGAVSYPEASAADDNLFGELRAAEGDWKKENVIIPIEKVETAEQKKFIGAAKEKEVEFDIKKAFSTETLATILDVSVAEAKEFSGKYFFKITNITHVEPAEINQELFDKVFGMGAATNEEEFAAKIKETISENYNRESNHFLDHSIEDYFIQNTKIELPADFLKSWLKVTSKGQITDDALVTEFDSYTRAMKWDMIKNRIADDSKITVDADEVRQKAKDLIIGQFGGQGFADQLKDKLDGIADNYLQGENGQNFMKIYNQLKSEKILRHIKDNITLQENKVSVDEFKKIVEGHTH